MVRQDEELQAKPVVEERIALLNNKRKESSNKGPESHIYEEITAGFKANLDRYDKSPKVGAHQRRDADSTLIASSLETVDKSANNQRLPDPSTARSVVNFMRNLVKPFHSLIQQWKAKDLPVKNLDQARTNLDNTFKKIEQTPGLETLSTKDKRWLAARVNLPDKQTKPDNRNPDQRLETIGEKAAGRKQLSARERKEEELLDRFTKSRRGAAAIRHGQEVIAKQAIEGIKTSIGSIQRKQNSPRLFDQSSLPKPIADISVLISQHNPNKKSTHALYNEIKEIARAALNSSPRGQENPTQKFYKNIANDSFIVKQEAEVKPTPPRP